MVLSFLPQAQAAVPFVQIPLISTSIGPVYPIHTIPASPAADSRPLDPHALPSLPQKRPIALFIRPPGTKPQPHKGRPRAPLEHQHREDDAEGEPDRRPDQERGEAAVPLYPRLAAILLWNAEELSGSLGGVRREGVPYRSTALPTRVCSAARRRAEGAIRRRTWLLAFHLRSTY